MERKFAFGILLGVAAGTGLAFGAMLTPGTPAVGQKVRDWFDFVDIGLRLAMLCIFLGGLVGTFAVLTSLRANTYSQMYGRFQAMLLKLAEHPEWFERMKRDEYTAEEDDPTHPDGPTHPHRFVANAMVNMYEEAYMLYQARVLSVFDTMPAEYWQSMVGSMRAAFRMRYLRTHWERRQDCFSTGFNQFVRSEILNDKTP